jgi:hypothetical protein
MSHPSQSSTFQSLFDVAIQDYEKQTGTKLADHPLAKQLEACESVVTVTAFLQERAQTFHEFRGEDGKFMRSLRRVVHVLFTLSTSAALAESIGLVVCPNIPQEFHISNANSTAIPTNESNIRWICRLACRRYISSSLCVHFHVSRGSLWQAVKDTTASYDTLVDLLESMEGFLNRLDIYAKFPPTPIMAEIIVKILVELLSTLAVATKQVEQGRSSESIFVVAVVT